ncbi:MAG: tetratricopeptide repeat protein [Planctomycetaceae bacterium]
MSRRRKKFSIPAVKKWFSATAGYYQRKYTKSLTNWRRWFRELLRLKDSQQSAGTDDRRKLPAGLSYINPIFWVLQSGAFVLRFLQTRQFLDFLAGLPALAGVLSPLMLEIWLVPTEQQQVARARASFRVHAQAKDFEQADFFLRQLAALQPGEPDHLLQRSLVQSALGHNEQARKVALSLMQDRGYLPAAEWLAEQHFKVFSDQAIPSEESWTALEQVIDWILARQPDHIKASFMRATGLMVRGEYSRAEVVLRKLVSQPRGNFAQALFSLAEVELNLGRETESRDFARAAADQLVQAYTREKLVLEDFVRLMRCLVLAHREQDAVQLITEAAGVHPDLTSELRELMLQVYVAHCRRLRLQQNRASEDLQQALDLITRALVISPMDARVTEELVALSGAREMSDETLELQLNAALAAGISPGTVHFILGTREMSRNPPNIAEAMVHFDLAQEHLPGMPGLLNNIADAMSDQPEADLERAMDLVNQALKYLPDQPAVYDTRGKILLRQGKTLEAIADFERALSDRQNPDKVHEHLAKAWEQAGNPQKAAIHRAIVEELQKQNTAKPAVGSN